MASREEILERLTVEIGADATSLIDALGEVDRKTEDATKKQETAWQKAMGAAQAYGKMLGGFVKTQILAVSKVLLEQTQATIKSAAALDRLSQKTGISAEALSTLTAAAEASGVASEVFEKGLDGLNKKLTDTGTAAERTNQFLGAVGLNLEDLKAKTPEDQLLTLADAFAKSQDGAGKARVASELFGEEVGRKLIPFLNKGKTGISELREQARGLGAEISTEFARSSARFELDMAKIGKVSQVAGRAIAAEFLPLIGEVSAAFLKEAEQGRILSGVLNSLGLLWEKFSTLATNALHNVELRIIGFSATAIQTLQGIPGLGEAFAGDLDKMKARFAEIKAERERQIAAEKQREVDLQIELQKADSDARKAEAGKTEVDLQKVQDADDAKLLKEREQKARESLESRLASVEKLTNAEEILRSTRAGAFKDFTETAKAELLVLAQKLDRIEANAKAEEQAKTEEKALQDLRNQLEVLQQVTAAEAARVEIKQQSLEIEDPLRRAEFERLSLAIQQEKERAAAAEEAARVAERNKEQADRLIESLETLSQQRAREIAEIQALAATNETVRAREAELIDATNKKFDEMEARGKKSVKGIGDSGQAAAKSLQQGFADFLFDPFGKSLTDMAKNFLDTMRKMVANQFAQRLLGGLFGGGSTPGIPLRRAAGGPIVGPGGPRADRVPILGSAGEFMEPADSVDLYGMRFMESVRRKMFPVHLARLGTGMTSMPVVRAGRVRYADGGPIAPPMGGAPSVTVPVDLTVANFSDREHLKRFLESREGRSTIVNSLGSDGGHELSQVYGQRG